MKFKESNIQFINEEHRENLEDLYEKLCKKRERMLIAEFLQDIDDLMDDQWIYDKKIIDLKKKWEQRKEGKSDE